MKDSREGILRAIRHALGRRADIPAATRDRSEDGIGGDDGRGGSTDSPRVQELFVERVSDYNATVVTTDVAGLPGAIAELLRARGARRIALPPGIPDNWLGAVPEGSVEWVRDGGGETEGSGTPLLSKGRLASVHGVITGCALAVAETGTIVLDSGPAQGRRALSLLPDYHLCVVGAGCVVESVPRAVKRMGDRVVHAGAPLTLISGPSATSDIELERVEGVHGPRTLEVILVEDQ